ncbi:MAG: hypothetical protein QXD03_05335 [Candidatus Anstonellales archaeon]
MSENGLFDYNDSGSWDKSTIEYVLSNENKVKEVIRSIALKRACKIHAEEIEDVYGELLLYLYKCDDYDINKAISNNGKVISLQNYVSSCAKYCLLRYLSLKESVVDSNITNEDGESISLLDLVSDGWSEDDIQRDKLSISDVLDMYKSYRYYNGIDLYSVLYIKLLAVKSNKGDKVNIIFNILGYNLDTDTCKCLYYNTVIRDIIYYASEDIDNVIFELSKYIPCKDNIKSAIENL